jgi:ketosteroid isomerase-like protein
LWAEFTDQTVAMIPVGRLGTECVRIHNKEHNMTSTDTSRTSKMVRQIFEAIDALDADRLAPFIADDVHFRFGSAEAITGKAGCVAAGRDFAASIAAVRHRITHLWEPEPGTAVAVLDVHYRRHDGGQLTLPCCNIIRFRDGLITDYRIYMDINPVYAPADAER